MHQKEKNIRGGNELNQTLKCFKHTPKIFSFL